MRIKNALMGNHIKFGAFLVLCINLSFSEKVEVFNKYDKDPTVRSYAVRSFVEKPEIRMSVYPKKLTDLERYLNSKRLASDKFSLSILFIREGNRTISLGLEPNDREFEGYGDNSDFSRFHGGKVNSDKDSEIYEEDSFEMLFSPSSGSADSSLSDQSVTSVHIVGLMARTESGEEFIRVYFNGLVFEDFLSESLTFFRERNR